jgi:hypothetical protein
MESKNTEKIVVKCYLCKRILVSFSKFGFQQPEKTSK